MFGAVLVAFIASIGSMLQGWDNSTIAGAMIYIKREFDLEKDPTMEGLIVAMSLVGGTFITTFSGPVSDSIGRRPMLMISSICYFVSSLAMLWSPRIYVLLLARLVDGCGIGISVTVVPIYISETAPPEIRGLLNTFPQFCGSSGMFLAYCVVFGMTFTVSPSWRLMLGFLSVPAFAYFLLIVLLLPESPRWLVSKGRMREAEGVLRKLRGREDVAGELALLVEGLDVGKEISIEEYIISTTNELGDNHEARDKDEIRLYGAEEGLSWVARPVRGQSHLAVASRQGSMLNHGSSIMDPLVTLFGSVHEKHHPGSTANSHNSMLFPNMGSILSIIGQGKQEQWDVESPRDGDDAASSGSDENMKSPLLLHQDTGEEKDTAQASSGNMFRRHSSLTGETASTMGIGGGWQLAYKYSETVGEDGRKVGGVQRMYLHQEMVPASRHGSLQSFHATEHPEGGEYVQAAALVSSTALCSSLCPDGKPAIGPPRIPPPEAAPQGPSWRDILEPGVKRALYVGIGLQVLQQFSGINGVLYYTPQILDQAGVTVLLSDLGIGAESASILISTLTTLLMLPCILISMRLMDISGRRLLMLATIPILIVALAALVLGSIINIGATANAIICTGSVVIYLSCFVMGFGAIPNILWSEIFPTRVRGLCITLCALTYWIGNIIVTYTLPILLKSLGLGGVFAIYGFMCIVSWFFVYVKVPETRGMPLEVISEFFSVGAKHAEATAAFN